MSTINVTRESGIPLIGHIAFGLVLRPNSNVIQIRATTICNLNCSFCSTDGGPFSRTHKNQFIIEIDYLIDWIKQVITTKGNTHINIDSVGEPTTHPQLVELVKKVKNLKEVSYVSMQSNGSLLSEQKIKELESAGLDRINLSLHALDAKLATELMGMPDYKVEKIIDVAKRINESKIELLLAPVSLPGVNDEQIKKIIEFAKELSCKIGIQKYEVYRYSRKEKNAKKMNYFKFYKLLKEWEKEFDIKLVYNAEDLQTERAQNIPLVFEVGEKIAVKVVAPGWMENQVIAAAKNRCITINDCDKKIGDLVNIKILENKNNIYLAEETQKNLYRKDPVELMNA